MIKIYEFSDHVRQVKSLSKVLQGEKIKHRCLIRYNPLYRNIDFCTEIQSFSVFMLYISLLKCLFNNEYILIHSAPEYQSTLEKKLFFFIVKFLNPRRTTVIIRDLRSSRGNYLLNLSCKKLVENERLYAEFRDQVDGYIYPTVHIQNFISTESKLKVRKLGIAGSFDMTRRDYSLIRKCIDILPCHFVEFTILGSNFGIDENLAKEFRINASFNDPKFIGDDEYSARLKKVDAVLLLNRFDDYKFKGTGIIGDAYEYGKPVIVLDKRFLKHSGTYIFSIDDLNHIEGRSILKWQIYQQGYFKTILKEICADGN